MSETASPGRWRDAVARAAGQMLAVRWRSTLEAVEAARLEYGALRVATIDLRAVRRPRSAFTISNRCAPCSRASCA
jgi:hypothetical protein